MRVQNEIKLIPHTIVCLNEENELFKETILIPFFNLYNMHFVTLNKNEIEEKLFDLTKYPINTKIIIINNFENKKDYISKIAKKNHYNLVIINFDFKEKRNFKSKKNPNQFNITHIDFKKYYRVVFEEYTNIQPDVNLYDKYCIIGDVHGCKDELIECVTDNKGIIYDEKLNELSHPIDENLSNHYFHHILIGDYLDKGPKIKETIEFIYKNRPWFWIIKGNHENFAYKFLKGMIGSYEEHKEMIDRHFSSIYLLQNDEELKNKFFELFENSYDYIQTDQFIATHAPCENIYLGKMDSVSQKNQRNIVYPKESEFVTKKEFFDNVKERLSFLLTESDASLPYHIFGHIMLKDVFITKNKIGIDTGCVVGNKLTSICFESNKKSPTFKQYQSKQSKTKELHDLFS